MAVDQGVLGVAEAPAAPLAPPHRWIDTSPHPWRRYFARSVDLVFLSLPGLAVLFFTLGVATMLAAPDGGAGLDDGWIAILALFLFIPAAIPVMALTIGLTGGSPGKWIFGIKVLGRDGRPLGFRRALVRELDIWLRGYALATPLISLITLLMNYSRLKEKGRTWWDERQGNLIVHRPWGPRDQAIAFAVVVAMIALSVAMRARDLAGH